MEKETPRCETCGAVGMDDHNDWCEAGKRAQEETPDEHDPIGGTGGDETPTEETLEDEALRKGEFINLPHGGEVYLSKNTETQTEEWENLVEEAGDFSPNAKVVHLPDVRKILSSHDAELARKIKGMRQTTSIGEDYEFITKSAFNQALNAVLALLGKENV